MSSRFAYLLSVVRLNVIRFTTELSCVIRVHNFSPQRERFEEQTTPPECSPTVHPPCRLQQPSGVLLVADVNETRPNSVYSIIISTKLREGRRTRANAEQTWL